MKRYAILFGLLLLLPLTTNATGVRLTGSAPADTLVDSLQVQVIIPVRIGLYLGNDVTFDLGTAGYPPSSFPYDYYPTSPASSPYVTIEVFSNSNTYTWYLDAKGNQDFDPTNIPISQLKWGPAGSTPSTSFSLSWANHASGGKTTGWQNENEDYIFTCEADDPAGTYTVKISYRLYAL